MSKSPEFTRLPKDLIKIGSPISYPVYDAQGNLLMLEGVIVKTEAQLEKLHARGLYLNAETSERMGLGKSADKSGVVNNDVKIKDNELEADVIVQLPFKTLKIGETFQLSPLNDDNGAVKYLAKYIGGLDKKSLICTVPLVDDKVIFIKEYTGFAVQLFSGKSVYRFNTVVDAVFSRPYPHMHLMFPREVSANRLRKNQRITVSIIVSIRNITPGPRYETISSGRFTDLSLGGSLIEVHKNDAEVGDQIECTFKISLDGGEALLVISGSIKNISKPSMTDGRTLYRYGMQFDEIAFQEKIMLQNYIFKAVTGEKLDDL